MQQAFLLLLDEAFLHVPLLVVLHSEEVFWVFPANNQLCKVVKNVFGHHAKDSIVLVPGMLITLVSVGTILTVEPFLDFWSPEGVISIAASTVPLGAIRPRVLESNKGDTLATALYNRPHVQD